MANDGINKRGDNQWELDVAAFLPDPEGFIKVDGEDYPVYSFLDLPVEDSLKVIRLGEDIEAAKENPQEKMARSIDQILLLNAGPEEGRNTRKIIVRERLTRMATRQIIALVFLANSIAAVPLKADSESASPAPEPADSTVGTTAA